MNIMQLFLRDGGDAPLFHVPTSKPEASCSRRQLLENVGRLTHAFKALGITADSRVLIIPANSLESLESILAVVSVGGIAVPVSPHIGNSSLGRIVDDLRPVCCISEEPLSTEVCALLAQSCVNMIVMRPGAQPQEAPGVRFHQYHELRDRYFGVLIPHERDDGDAALLLHTSGSTGHPKRIYRTHGQLAAFIGFNRFLFAQFCRHEGDKVIPNPVLTALPLSHLSGLGYCMEGLYSDTPIYLLRQFDAALVLELIEKLRCRFLILIPSLYELLLHELEQQPHRDVSSLKYCVYGGEACPAELASRIEKRFGVRPVAAYGLTECIVGIAHDHANLEAGTYKPDSCGRHLMGEIRLVDEHGADNPERGELWVRNRTIPSHTLHGVTDARVTPDGWFKTGDVLSRDEDGCFFHRGRVDDMFLCNGNNVYPLQVEQLLLTHPGIDAACVTPIRNRRGHTIPAALVRRTSPVTTAAELIELARRRGPGYAVPAFIEFADQFPVAPSGKLDRAGIRARLQHAYETES